MSGCRTQGGVAGVAEVCTLTHCPFWPRLPHAYGWCGHSPFKLHHCALTVCSLPLHASGCGSSASKVCRSDPLAAERAHVASMAHTRLRKELGDDIAKLPPRILGGGRGRLGDWMREALLWAEPSFSTHTRCHSSLSTTWSAYTSTHAL